MRQAGQNTKIKEVRLKDFEKYLKYNGYVHKCTNGSSHHIYYNYETRKKVCVVSKHKRTVHPKSIIIALHEMQHKSSGYCDWMVENI